MLRQQTNNIVAYNNTDCQEGNIDKNGDSNTNSGYDTAYYNVFTVEGTAASRVFFRIVA